MGEICRHRQQVVKRDHGTMIQKCLECGELMAKWLARTQRYLYNLGQSENPKTDH